jgi:anti-sigma-K factor RskA
MNTPAPPFEQDPPEQSVLVGEYVLGVLDSQQRTAVQQRIAQDPAFAKEVVAWENHLAALADEIDPVTVPDYVWARISSALAFGPAVRVTPVASEPSFWSSAAPWRWLAGGGFAAAAVSMIALLNAVRVPEPAAPVFAPPMVTTPAPVQPAAPTEMAATLTDDSGKPGYVATMDAASGRITVTSLQPVVADAKVPELWLIPPDGVARSLGVFADSATHSGTLPADYIGLLSTEAILAITLEPPGGAPGGVATGSVVAKGGIQLLAMNL